MRKIETHLNSDEQVREYLTKALALVAELDVPEQLQSVAFVKACDLFASKNVQLEQVAPNALGMLGMPRN